MRQNAASSDAAFAPFHDVVERQPARPFAAARLRAAPNPQEGLAVVPARPLVDALDKALPGDEVMRWVRNCLK